MTTSWKIRVKVRSGLLWIINRWLGGSSSGPLYYGLVNGLEAVSYQSLVSEDFQQPGITVRELIDGIDRFNACPIGKGVMVIEGSETREATVWDIHELRQSFTSKASEGQSDGR